MIDVTSLSAYELSQKLHSGEISSVDLCTAYLERIKKFEKDVQAWQFIDKKLLIEKAEEADTYRKSGKQYSVKFFVEKCCSYLELEITWKGKGLNEYAEVKKIKNQNICPGIKVGQKIVKIDKKYFRPLDVDNLIGDMKKASKELNWQSKTSISQLIKTMIDEDYKKLHLQNK